MGQPAPVAASPKPLTLQALFELLQQAERPDDRFADDLAEIQAS